MKISKVRKELKLTETAFIQKLEPMMKAQGSSLTRQILQKVEAGEEISAHRLTALICAIEKEFPEISGVELQENSPSGVSSKIKSFGWEIILVLVLGGVLASYFFIEIVRKEIGIFSASVLPIIIVVFSIYQYITRNR